uniref:Odorant receptor n=1 Tax=Glossina austeni TaxID=7395 RepID=A0A1A9VBT8_GLOAU
MDPNDLLGRTTSLAISLFCVNAVSKILFVAHHHKELGKIIHKLMKYFPTTREGQRNFNLHYEFKTVRRVSSIMLWTHLITAALFDLTPPITFGVEYMNSGGKKEFNFILPYGIWYPWDYKDSGIGIFVFTYMSQLLGSYVAVAAFVVPDLLLISVVALANMNFRYISKLIREFKPTGTNEDFTSLGQILHYHDDILNMIDEVNDVFSFSVLLSFFSFGGMLRFSTDVSVALTDHPWYDGSINYQRMLPFPIARAQRPAQLLGYKFFIVSMESFQSLMTTSYQLFTLIKARYDENN